MIQDAENTNFLDCVTVYSKNNDTEVSTTPLDVPDKKKTEKNGQHIIELIWSQASVSQTFNCSCVAIVALSPGTFINHSNRNLLFEVSQQETKKLFLVLQVQFHGESKAIVVNDASSAGKTSASTHIYAIPSKKRAKSQDHVYGQLSGIGYRELRRENIQLGKRLGAG